MKTQRPASRCPWNSGWRAFSFPRAYFSGKRSQAYDLQTCPSGCGVGEKALYLNSFYIDRRYYITYPAVTRVFKRVAMSQGGFSQKGIFASIPYLVVEYDGGKQKQCNFKYEEQVDQMLDCIGRAHPEIKLVSAAAEARLAQREAELAARKKPELSHEAQRTIRTLQDAAAYLDQKPALTDELSKAARRKRAYLCSKPSYRWVALAITVLGLLSLLYGIVTLVQGTGSFGIYFALFGIAAIFMFSGVSVLPTARNNKNAIMARADRAKEEMAGYLKGYRGEFPLPARYAHPIVLRRMVRVIEEGRAARVTRWWPSRPCSSTRTTSNKKQRPFSLLRRGEGRCAAFRTCRRRRRRDRPLPP